MDIASSRGKVGQKNAPSTTAPMTWWILPTPAVEELANLAPKEGTRLRRAREGRAKAALPRDRARPLCLLKKTWSAYPGTIGEQRKNGEKNRKGPSGREREKAPGGKGNSN